MTAELDVHGQRPTAEHAPLSPARPSASGLRAGLGLRGASAADRGRTSDGDWPLLRAQGEAWLFYGYRNAGEEDER